MSLDVRIKKSFGDYTLDVAFAGGDETLGFLDRDDADGAAVAFETNEMSYLHQHMFWRVSMREGVALPEVGERLWVRIPPDKVYLVSR